MKRCVIIGGAEIKKYDWVRSHLKDTDFNIFCDSGLRHLEKLCIKPSLITGDFDSYAEPKLPVETIKLPCEKDDTDTVFAVKEAIKRGYDDFVLIGVVGERFDHTMGNISILLMLNALHKTAEIIDDYSQMQIVSDFALIEDKYSFFSLLNISGIAKGITIENAKYPLENAQITCEYAYGVSNEVLKGKTAKVSIKEGKLLLVKIV